MDIQIIQNKIYEIRGQRVMLDFDLASRDPSTETGSKAQYRKIPRGFHATTIR